MITGTSDPNLSLVSQAQAILEVATSLQQQLESASLPQPSFSSTGRRDWHDASHLPSILETRLKLLDAAQSMFDLVMGPLDTLVYLVGPMNTQLEVLRTLDKLKIAEHVPIEGDTNIVELADKLGLNRNVLERHLRCGYLMGIFRESREGYVAHTGVSAAMPGFSPYTEYRMGELLLKGAFHVADSMKIGANEKAPIPVEVADKANGGRKLWEQLVEDDPEGKGMEKFSTAMQVLGVAYSGGSFINFLQSYDWASLGQGTVVDLGGGNGHITVNLAKHLPDLHFIVQDLESNAEPGKQNIQQNSLEDRVRYQTQDFFEPQPADLKPAAYLLSRVLHDWQDDDCVRILRPLLPAMENYGTKLLIIDRIMPDKVGELPRFKEWHLRMTDILMYTLFTAKERSLKDWDTLFKMTDKRLKVVACRQPANAVFGCLEIELGD